MLAENRYLEAKIDVGRTNQEIIACIIWLRDDDTQTNLVMELVRSCWIVNILKIELMRLADGLNWVVRERAIEVDSILFEQ